MNFKLWNPGDVHDGFPFKFRQEECQSGREFLAVSRDFGSESTNINVRLPESLAMKYGTCHVRSVLLATSLSGTFV